MSVTQTAEQEQFAASLHDLLSGADVPGAARRWAAGDPCGGLALWRKLAGLGVTALAVPERHGGLSASMLDVVIACEELGHHALPGPVAESVAAVPHLIGALAGESPAGESPPDAFPPGVSARDASAAGDLLAGRWLPGLAAGEVIATLAMPPRLPYAADADAAGLVLLADGDLLHLAAPAGRHRSVDPARSLWRAGSREVLARGPAVAAAASRAFDAGALACAAQLLGAGRALLEASVRHVGQRTQFGQPIGAFQAVKHHLADVAIGLEFARPLLGEAAAALGGGGPTAARDVSAAKVTCTDAAYLAARVALQVHGAIGYTQEHDLHLWLTKIRALAGAWGSQAEHRGRVMAAIAAGGDAAWN
jgi:hypothetical protein